MPKKGDPPTQSLFNFVERLQPSARTLTKAFGLDKITPDLVAKMQGFPNATALGEFLKRMRAQDEQLQVLLKSSVQAPVAGARPSVQPESEPRLIAPSEVPPTEAPSAGPAAETTFAKTEPIQLEFSIHLPSLRAFWGSIAGIGATSLLSIKALEAATLAAKFLWADTHYLYAALGAGIVAVALIPGWSAVRLALLSLGYISPKRPPWHLRSKRAAHGLQVLIVMMMLGSSLYLFTTAYQLAEADWRVVYNRATDWLSHQKGLDQWRRGTTIDRDSPK
jgi:hypothetical protein